MSGLEMWISLTWMRDLEEDGPPAAGMVHLQQAVRIPGRHAKQVRAQVRSWKGNAVGLVEPLSSRPEQMNITPALATNPCQQATWLEHLSRPERQLPLNILVRL
jgi:hypothetical protein